MYDATMNYDYEAILAMMTADNTDAFADMKRVNNLDATYENLEGELEDCIEDEVDEAIYDWEVEA